MEIITSTNKFSIKQIFQDNWQKYLAVHQDLTPDYVITTVEKMLSCRNPHQLGYHKYACPEHPEQYIVVPHSCKSRFCNCCGKILTDKWVKQIESQFPSVPFHHICFTIPQELRELLKKYNFLLNCLFTASKETVLSFCKERNFIPAIISCLHSFGRDLKDHPHIHMLVSAGGISLKNKRKNQWKHFSYFPFVMLMKRYRFFFIAHLKKSITNYLKKHPEEKGELRVFRAPEVLDAFFDPFLEINWYVYDSTELEPEKFTTGYLLRYTKRPPVAECRIKHYGEVNFAEGIWVTFTYKERENSPIDYTIPVEEFIHLLIQHILPPNFRVVRYYGLLSSKLKRNFEKILDKLARKSKEKEKFINWRKRQIAFTGKDPFICPICKKEFQLIEIGFFSTKENKLIVYQPQAPP